MGIKNFFKITIPQEKAKEPKTIKDLGHLLDLSSIAGMVVAIDAASFIYAATKGMPHLEAMTHDGQSTAHLSVMFYKVKGWKMAGLTQVWVFDGAPPSIKSKEITKRKKAKEKARLEMEKGGISEERRIQLSKRANGLAPYVFEETKQLLRYMGISYVQAPEEAEAYCAQLVKMGECDYVMSPDSDALMFGSPSVIRPDYYVKPGTKTKRRVFYEYKLAEILEETGLNHKQLIQVGLHMGCDFADKTPRIGPKTVIKKVKSNSGLKNSERKPPFTKEQLKAFKYFIQATDLPKARIKDFDYSHDRLWSFLEGKGFNMNRLSKHFAELDNI